MEDLNAVFAKVNTDVAHFFGAVRASCLAGSSTVTHDGCYFCV